MQERQADTPIAEMFLTRWSPRSFLDTPVEPEKLASLFEAARWAPSCYNDQPWEFFYVTAGSPAFAEFVKTLVPLNQEWAAQAPVLLYVVSRNAFSFNGQPNPWAPFDAGAAWMSFALQAQEVGLHAHGMAGFDAEAATRFLRLDPKHYTVRAAVALGYRGRPEQLPPHLREKEFPAGRKPAREFVHRVGE